ncbi:hypothetical protein HNP48_004834 [Acidovorax soli]|jgi:hypothetical protein|uniref:Lipoprotein n=1 Tax=Acidovorax soli TaxID=592050 RepID=A0A7X0UC09_9BURK|nr:hypothetical protein [Acidovorax soli]MBB6562125.1 hypothetical protein [Acidovorax soli]
MKETFVNRRFGLAVIACAVLAGCAAPNQHLFSADKPLVGPDTGLLLATLGYTVPQDPGLAANPPSLTLGFRSADPANPELSYINTTGPSRRVTGGFTDWPAAVRTSGGDTRLLIGYRMKPGRYVFTEQYVYIGGYYTYTAKPPMAGPKEFVIKAGEVTYVGSHTARLLAGTNVFGRTVPSSAAVWVSNDLLADLDLLHSLRPEMRTVLVNNALRR